MWVNIRKKREGERDLVVERGVQQKLKEKRIAYKKWQGTREEGEEGIRSVTEKISGKQGERWQLQRELHGSSRVMTWALLGVGQRCSRLHSR